MMNAILQGISGVVCYLDDVLVSSQDFNGQLKTLE
jgi:hypothetical protein